MMKNKRKSALLCGLLGCLCYGGGDWLMLYGDPAHAGALIWLTEGTAQIPLWRYDLAMALAFPGIILYGIALFTVETYIRGDRERRPSASMIRCARRRRRSWTFSTRRDFKRSSCSPGTTAARRLPLQRN